MKGTFQGSKEMHFLSLRYQSRAHRNGGHLVTACTLVVLLGCSSGHVGTVVGRYTAAQGAVLVDTYAIGLEIRPRAETRGITLGFHHDTYIFGQAATEVRTPIGRWFYFCVPFPNTESVAVNSVLAGFDLEVNPNMAGAEFGLEHQFVTRVPARGSTLLHLRYNPRSPAQTILDFQVNETQAIHANP
jgi:hypothetical protein